MRHVAAGNVWYIAKDEQSYARQAWRRYAEIRPGAARLGGTRAAEGLAGADIGIGERNNFSFAASEDKEMAAKYTYELGDDLFTICRMGDDGNVRAHVDTETVVV